MTQAALSRFALRGFNRNIVECKLNKFTDEGITVDGFNRNIVECKLISLKFLIQVVFGFNRNIVECKQIAAESEKAASEF